MMRVMMGLLLGAGFLAAILWFPLEELGWLVLALVALGLVELTRMKFTDPIERWTVVVVGIIVAGVFIFGLPHPALILALLGGLFVCALVIMWRSPSMEGAGDRLGFAALAMLYVSIALPFWFLLRQMDHGAWWVLLGIAPACLSDAFAFLFGKAFGRHPFAPRVSPKKTIEGFFGALVGSAIGVAVILYAGGGWLPWWHAAIIALVIWWLSPLGDLVESMIKRSCGVKDSGTIIRGHGGALDRLDAIIFVGPFLYVYAKYLW